MAKYKGDQHRAKRSFGQNFLVDERYIGQIAAALQVSGDDVIIEIGAGQGALTEALLATGKRVLAIEIDRDLHPLLLDKFRDNERFSLIAGDILKVDLVDVLNEAQITSAAKLAGNLPYNISTAILERVAAARHHFSTIIFMFQREVVERITAAPGNSDRGYLTVLVESAFASEYLFDVPPEAFSPRPRVMSSVVRLKPKPASPGDDAVFRKLVSVAFLQKRKTILNNLKHSFPDAEAFLAAAEIDSRRRAETLTIDEWYRLFESTYKKL